jgi:excinuclease ABC subunit B
MFELVSEFEPTGDQPAAIDKLVSGVEGRKKHQVLLGVTGSGKTFTMANVIARTGRPALILAHNKTLAAQLYEEFKAFFPKNAVEYFVSYYDYYQPEAYIARSDTYIEKDLAINERIEKLRLSATRSLIERDDVIIVSSVSCIYGLGMPEHYREMNQLFERGMHIRRDHLLLRLVDMSYMRSDLDLAPATFRVRGDVIEIFPAYEESLAYRLEFFDDELEEITAIDPLLGRRLDNPARFTLYPATHYAVPKEAKDRALSTIREELKERTAFYESEGRPVEQLRIHQRTTFDLEMIKEMGTCKGVENYSRHFSGRPPGEAPSCLIDYFEGDWLLFVDESHQTIPQVRAMYNGDRARKESLIEFGFRLPSAFDNRPLKFDEFYGKITQAIHVSATPAPWEIAEAGGEVIEQIIRPTGLLDPKIEVRPAHTQVDDALGEIKSAVESGGRVLVTTLTKRLAEELSNYLNEIGVLAKYLHSDIDTLERMEILTDLRRGNFDVLVGINLLREGLDLPEVTLVAILDADKEGFLRSATALIQTCGRAARNAKGRVIMYADKETSALRETIETTERRRALQEAYNKKHGIEPRTTMRSIASVFEEEKAKAGVCCAGEKPKIDRAELEKKIAYYRKMMRQAAKDLRFEDAARFRDLLRECEEIEVKF